MKKHNFGMMTMAAIALLGVVLIGACKHSGMAVSDRGQLMKIDIELPQDLSDGQNEKLLVTIANRGVNTIDNVIFEVEMPNELVIIDQKPQPWCGVDRPAQLLRHQDLSVPFRRYRSRNRV